MITEYFDLMTSGVEFPPVAVVRGDGGYLLVDGFLRFEAAKLAQSKDDALRSSPWRSPDGFVALCGSQCAERCAPHMGRQAARGGKLLNDLEWRKWSDREIARVREVQKRT